MNLYPLLPKIFINRILWTQRYRLYSTFEIEEPKTIHDVNLRDIPLENIRNFSIIAHIDHGKSTMADRILEHSGAISTSVNNHRVLDTLPVEKERGITVKAQTASFLYHYDKKEYYLLNLIDTPGHVDFSTEVSRSLSASQGVLLLVDANKGIQAQTVSNFYLAFANDLTIIPVLNKMDLPNAQPDTVKEQLRNLFDIEASDVILSSAKTGMGIEQILKAIVERIPSPSSKYYGSSKRPLRCFLQDSWFDRYKGAVNLIQVIEGTLSLKCKLTSVKTDKTYPIKTLGILTPSEWPVEEIYPGQVGYLTCNMRLPNEAIIGDTYYDKASSSKDSILPWIQKCKESKPMVFAGFYPLDQSELPKLKNAIEKLCLNDSSVMSTVETSIALGQGWRLGFLGLLHLEVFSQRLEDEFDAHVVITTPSVPYRVILMNKTEMLEITNPAHWPLSNIQKTFEPVVKGTIISPSEYMSAIYSLCTERRGIQTNSQFIDDSRLKMEFLLPLNEIITDFFNDLKALTSGYGSFDYEEAGYKETNLVKIDFLLNSSHVDELSLICHKSGSHQISKRIVVKLRDHLPRQQFSISIQAAIGGKIIAREDIKAYRKDVTAKLYGGDLTRKQKLLKNQAKGKKRMRMIGNIEISKDVFIKILSK